MPRRKSAATVRTPTASHKRHLSTASSEPNGTPGSRQSKRIKASADSTPVQAGKVTPRKSKYFEQPGSDEEDEGGDTTTGETSGYDDDDSVDADESPAVSSSDEIESDVSETDSDDEKPKRKARGPKKSQTQSHPASTDLSVKGKELWRPGVKTGLGPGKQVFIAMPKARGDGGIPYTPEKIHPNTMAFLGDLKENNDREWLKANDKDFRASWKDWETFVEALTEKIMEKDDTIPELPAKDLFFRIYRDIRFSPDPTPYKPYFSAAWSRTGRKGPFAAYYVQIAPKKTFIGCGLWMPEAAPLALLRRDIDRQPEYIKSVLNDSDIRKKLLNSARDERRAVQYFLSQNADNALKTKPKGYAADHPNIGLLRLKNYTIGTKLEDKEVTSADFLNSVASLVETMVPFVHYLNSIVMPDEDSDDDDDDDDDEGEDGNAAE